jgi:hypothetical protein
MGEVNAIVDEFDCYECGLKEPDHKPFADLFNDDCMSRK